MCFGQKKKKQEVHFLKTEKGANDHPKRKKPKGATGGLVPYEKKKTKKGER